MSYPPSPTGPDDRGYEAHGYPAPVGDLPPRPAAPGARLGRASGIEVRQESQYAGENRSLSVTVLAFRLLEPGSRQPLDVLLRGRSLSGAVREGDWVEVTGPPDATGRWNVAKVQNLTTASTVIMMGGRRSKAASAATLVALSLVAVLFVLIGLVVVVNRASS